MRARVHVVLIVLVIVAAGARCQAQERLTWEVEYPWSTVHIGTEVEVVIEPDTGRVAACGIYEGPDYSEVEYVRFFGRDGWVGDWRGFVWGGSSGNYFGEDVSMAVTLAPAGLRTGFAYHNETDSSLEYKEYDNGPHDVVSDSLLGNDGLSNSLVFQADGTANIASRTVYPLGDDSLVHDYRVGSGGNCGGGTAAGAWQCDTVDSAEGIGRYISMDLDENGFPMIAYTSGTGYLNLAEHNGSGTGNCGFGDAAGMWDCTSVVTTDKSSTGITAADYGGHVALAVDPNAPATGKHMAFLTTDNATGEQYLDYATWVGSGGTCSDPRWDCMWLTDVGNGTVDLDMVVDGNGLPLIVYRDAVDNQVRLAWGSDGAPGSGNCGPSNTWRCDILAEGSAFNVVGNDVAIDVGPDGEPVVAYSAWNTIQSVTDLIILHPWIDRDFFETGDLTWWDSNAP